MPRRPALQHSGAVDGLGDRFFLPVRHDVNASDPLDLVYLLDQVHAKIAALARLILRAGEARDDRVGYVHARDVGAHPLGGLGRFQRPDADQDEHFIQESQLLDVAHEYFDLRDVIAVLRLDKLRAGFDLLGQTLGPELVGRHGRVLGGTEEYPGSEADLAATLEVVPVAQAAGDVEQGQR